MTEEAGSPLLITSLVMVAAAAALLVAGVFRDESTLLYLSIGASVAAASLLVFAVALRRRTRGRR